MLISQYVNSFGNTSTTYQYQYDTRGNITSIYLSENEKYITYEYDDLNCLVRENNELLGKTYVIQYDINGNILHKREYPYTTAENLGTATDTNAYTYSNTAWGDQLTAYNGNTITYDEIGNPETYYDGFTFTWNGRQLSRITQNGVNTNYAYDGEGIRISKSGARNTEYIVLDGVYLGERTTVNNTTHLITYIYGVDGSVTDLTVMNIFCYRNNILF